mmetsp:Transcript_59642/g.164875  ORF Transcript_59642/g.164875 Transcript_59642/m.164875 type:complete len:344 (+) Transcript_59642:94-1125(+)
MACPSYLPSLRSIHQDFRPFAWWFNGLLYVVILSYTGWQVVSVFLRGPQMVEDEETIRDSMPWIKLCLDNSTFTLMQSAGFVSEGFGYSSAESTLSGSCQTSHTNSSSLDSSRWVIGSAVEGTQGRCHMLDLRHLYPFANDATVNNLMIGGVAHSPLSDQLFPRFIAVATSDEPSTGFEGMSKPLLYLYPQRFRRSFNGDPERIESPSYCIDKTEVPSLPLPTWGYSRQHAEYVARNLGMWRACVPMYFQRGEGLVGGEVVFGFGLIVTSPVVKIFYSAGIGVQLLKLIGNIGGFCGACFFVWQCFFVPVREESERAKWTLNPALPRRLFAREAPRSFVSLSA